MLRSSNYLSASSLGIFCCSCVRTLHSARLWLHHARSWFSVEHPRMRELKWNKLSKRLQQQVLNSSTLGNVCTVQLRICSTVEDVYYCLGISSVLWRIPTVCSKIGGGMTGGIISIWYYRYVKGHHLCIGGCPIGWGGYHQYCGGYQQYIEACQVREVSSVLWGDTTSTVEDILYCLRIPSVQWRLYSTEYPLQYCLHTSTVLIVSLHSADGIPPQSWWNHPQYWTPSDVLMVPSHSICVFYIIYRYSLLNIWGIFSGATKFRKSHL